jgi:ketosteroid isomerase-like protein
MGLAGCSSAPAPAPVVDTSAADQAAIRVLEDKFGAAFNAKDVNAIMALYSSGDDLVVFDVVPPRQYTGWAAYKKDWDDTFAAYPGPVVFQLNDLVVNVGGDVAYGHSIQEDKHDRARNRWIQEGERPVADRARTRLDSGGSGNNEGRSGFEVAEARKAVLPGLGPIERQPSCHLRFLRIHG